MTAVDQEPIQATKGTREQNSPLIGLYDDYLVQMPHHRSFRDFVARSRHA